MRRCLFLFGAVLLAPAFASAGSQTFSTPGTHSFTVPSYGTLTVQVWGGGGSTSFWDYGSSGGPSSFNGTVIAYGGAPSSVANGGAGGGASGGDTNISGGNGANGSGYRFEWPPYPGGKGGDSPNGGTGGAGGIATLPPPSDPAQLGKNGNAPGGGGGGTGQFAGYSGNFSPGGGGAGGYASKTYASGQLSGTVSVVVGARGALNGFDTVNNSGHGARGEVRITWTDPAATCSVSADSNPLEYGESTILNWTSANATTMYINNIGYVTANQSSYTTVGPLSTTDYSCTVTGAGGNGSFTYELEVDEPASCAWNGGSIENGEEVTAYLDDAPLFGESCTAETRTCTNGTLSGTFTYASCTEAPVCTESWSCSGTTIVRTNADCSTTNLATCTAPSFCSPGVAACVNPAPSFNGSGSFTGHLQARPRIVNTGGTAKLHWNVSNVTSCQVSGNGQTFTGLASPSTGATTSAILTQAIYTLTCVKIDETTFSESTVINVIPGFREL